MARPARRGFPSALAFLILSGASGAWCDVGVPSASHALDAAEAQAPTVHLPRGTATDVGGRCGHGELSYDAARVFFAPGGPTSIVTGRFDAGNEHFDLTAIQNHALTTWLGLGGGAFDAPRVRHLGNGIDLGRGATGDFDEDGLLDVVLTDGTGAGGVLLVLGSADGGFQGPVSSWGLGGGSKPAAIVVADFDGDDHLDVATANAQTHSVTVLPGVGTGAFDPTGVQHVPLPSMLTPAALAAVDIDGDGDRDLVVAGLLSGRLVVLRNAGGAFDPVQNGLQPIEVPMQAAGGGAVEALAVLDVDFDGVPDLLASAEPGGKHVSVRKGRPPSFPGAAPWDASFPDVDLLFADAVVGDLECKVDALIGGDLDRDGIVDLVAGTQCAPARVLVLLGAGGGVFHRPVALPVSGPPPAELALADFNDDGLADIVAGSNGSRAYLLASRCRCFEPWSGATCDVCSAESCPGVGTPLDEDLVGGPPGTVQAAAALVAASTTPAFDDFDAAVLAQTLVAAGLEADLVLVAVAVGKTVTLEDRGGHPFARTLTTLEVRDTIAGDPPPPTVEVVQWGGLLGETQYADSLHVPLADEACASGSSGEPAQYLIFLERLYGDRHQPMHDAPLLPVLVDATGGFVAVDGGTNLTLPLSALAGVLAGGAP